MKVNTAIGVLAAAGGSILLQNQAQHQDIWWRVPLSVSCGLFAFLLGALTLVEYTAGISIGLDEMLFADLNSTSLPYPGRMAPVTAAVLACTGLAILLLAYAMCRSDQIGFRSAWVGHMLATVPAGAGYLGFAGYAYDVPGLYSFGPYSTVALNTSAAFLLLAPALLFTRSDLGWARRFAGRPVARRMMWRLLPASLLLPFLVGAVVVLGARMRAYDPLFGPALFALAAAASSLGMALFAVEAVRQAEVALLESEERHRLIVESAQGYAIVTLNTEGQITGWNVGAERMMGYTEIEVIGQPAAIFFTPEDVAAGADKAEMKRAASEGRAEDERWHCKRDGSSFWGSGLIMPLAGTPGHGYVKIFQDRTAAHTAGQALLASEAALAASEAELRRSNEALEMRVREAVAAREAALARLAHAQRMEALGQLAGGIAHDFNNVMQAVQGGAGLIRRRISDPQTVDHLARMVEEAAERGASVTRRLLAFARKGELRAEALIPLAILEDLQEVLEHTLGTGIAVRTQAASPLPLLLADKGQLETVLVNLAANARDAMPHGGTLTLSAAAETVTEAATADRAAHEVALAPGRYVRLAVSDTGEGMTAAVLARASEPFFTTKEQGKGTGLGLAMARGFAEQSEGGMAIRSMLGAGTTVTLWLPVAEGAEPSQADNPGRKEAPQPTNRVQVFVVDDEDLVREVVSEGLEERGYATQRVSGGAAALAMLDAGAALDVLLTDYTMPGMDGLTLIGEARRRRPGLASILLTGNANGEVEARLALEGLAGGPFSLVRKPVRADALATRIAAVLTQKAGTTVH